MEDLAMTWPPANSSLEPLRPLTPDVFDEDDIADLGISGGRKLSRSEIAGKLLDHLDELNSEEPEPFDWFATEKSIDLPFFDNVPSPQYYQPKIQNNVQKFHNYAFQIANDVKTETQTSPQDYNQYDELSRSLEIPVTLAAAMAPSPQHHVMYSSPVHVQYAMSSPIATVMPGQVSPMVSTIPVPMLSPVSSIPDTKPEWVKAETLTPPDSPKDDDIMKLLEEMEPNEMDQLAIARRMLQEIPAAELEQLVMTRVDDIASTFSEKSCSMDDFSDSGGASSPCHGSESGGDDPEWSPPRRMKSASGYSSTASSTCTTTSKKKSKPYSRPAPEDRKLRKKEQNKNAATRYRMKKKAEVEEVRNEEKKLEDKNKALKEELDDINREVKYLKSLMRDVYRKKGLIK